MASCSARHVVAVVGCTGVGKSNLALQVAEYLKSAEIISADAIQVYEGFDIISNKVTPEEQALVPHHMISVADPFKPFNVTDFVSLALPKVKTMRVGVPCLAVSSSPCFV